MKTASFDGKVAAVTGAGSGIGRALALALCERGCAVAASDIDGATLDETAALCRASGQPVSATRVDVADRGAVFAWADAVARQHGKVNLVFNNAGVALASSIEGASIEDQQWIVGINFWGVVHGTQAFLPHLRASGDGHVVNISSVFGLVAVAGNGAYNATKFAVRGYTEALRQELEITRAPVSATCVHPGGVKTNVARAARISPSLKDLVGADTEASRARFEKLFITSPERAARQILRGVQSNRRRVLVGPDAVLIDLIARFLPGVAHRLAIGIARRLASAPRR
jgi:NAD(P)-dependent dehydrogenase (short-subunit alcohol dehydrogenase family)